MDDRWITYTIPVGRGTELITRRATAPEPKRQSSMPRPATPAEIEEALSAEREGNRRDQLRSAWKSRQEYEDAQAIRDTLELMTVDNHPLDRLTPAEWRTLRDKLCR